MVPTERMTGGVVQLIAAQPHSQGKVEAAWHLAVGGALARLSPPVRSAGGVVYVKARDRHVARQLEAHRAAIESRLRDVLGREGRVFIVEC